MLPVRLAHYELREKVGRGGMGIVFRAWDTRLERSVAVKILPAHLARDPERRARFFREARAAARLNHPNIATLHDVGEAEVDQPELLDEGVSDGSGPVPVVYLVMEFVEGEDLEARLAAGDLEPAEALELACQVARGLEAAHAGGVVHRDLKPHNLRITPGGTVKILDFGLAKLLAPREASGLGEESVATSAGMILGTAPYMAPEQVHGEAVDARTDLFALGVILYRMLAGRLPFASGNLVQYVKALAGDEPQPLSDRVPGISPELEGIVARLLAKRPAERYETAGAVAEDLGRILEGPPTPSAPAMSRSLFGDAFRGPRAPRLAVAFGAILLILVALALLPWAAVLDRGDPEDPGEVRTVLVLPFENHTGEEGLTGVCRGLAFSLRDRLAEAPDLVARRPLDEELAAATGRDGRDTDAPVLVEGRCRELGADRVEVDLQLVEVATGNVLASPSFTGRDLRQLEGELAYRAVRALGTALSGKRMERLRRHPSRSSKALNAYYEGLDRLESATGVEAFEAARESLGRALELDRRFARAEAALAEVHLQLWDLTRQETHVAAIERAARNAVFLDPDLPAARIALAQALRLRGHLEEAVAQLEAVLAADPRSVEALWVLARLHGQAGRLREAERTLRRAVALRPDYWRYHNQLAVILVGLGEAGVAVEAFEEADRLSPPDVQRPRRNLGHLQLHLGRAAEALDAYEGLEGPVDHPLLAENMARAYLWSGDVERADALSRRAVELQPDVPSVWDIRGDVLAVRGQETAARGAWSRALMLLEAQLEHSPRDIEKLMRRPLYRAKLDRCEDLPGPEEEAFGDLTADMALNLAEAHALCGNRGPALTLLERSLAGGTAAGYVEILPAFERYRDDPAFRRLVSGAGGAARAR